jgi:hypothetical protein
MQRPVPARLERCWTRRNSPSQSLVFAFAQDLPAHCTRTHPHPHVVDQRIFCLSHCTGPTLNCALPSLRLKLRANLIRCAFPQAHLNEVRFKFMFMLVGTDRSAQNFLRPEHPIRSARLVIRFSRTLLNITHTYNVEVDQAWVIFGLGVREPEPERGDPALKAIGLGLKDGI